MDQGILVTTGHALMRALDAAMLAPQIAMWVHSPETDSWKLWIVPPDAMKDKQEFYRKIAETIANHRQEMGDLSASDIEMAAKSHPAMQGIGSFFRMDGFGNARFSGNRFNGFYLPDGIILRSALGHPMNAAS